MPARHQPKTLVKLSLVTIARNFSLISYGIRDKKDMSRILEDDSYLQQLGPFVHFPSRLLEQAMEVIQDDNSIRHVQTRHLHMLLQPQLESLYFSFGTGNVYSAVEILQQRCQKLKYLNISQLMSVGITPPYLTRLFKSLPALVSLNLSSTETNDDVLADIGANCPSLRDIDVTMCPISDKGPYRLLWDPRRRLRTCCHLQSLVMTDCPITPSCIRQVLQIQPTLKEAEFENNLLAFDPQYSGLWEDEMIFNVTSLNALSVDITDTAMDTITDQCPYVTHLSITTCFITNDCLLKTMAWSNLISLSLTNTEDECILFTESVLPILTIRGEQLTTLLLSRFTYVDISAIGLACPKIENLALSNISLYEPVTGQRKNEFKELKALEVWSDLSNTTLSDIILRCLLLNATNLSNLLISGSEHFSDLLLEFLWISNQMNNLSRLTIDSCPHFTAETLINVFDMDNKLTLVRVWNCPKVLREHEKFILHKIKQENMDIYFEWFAWTG